jgi:hypothetical protein
MAALNERPKLSFDARDVSPTSEWQAYIAAYNFQGASSDNSTLHNPAIILSIPRARHYKTTAVCALDDSAKDLRLGATTQATLTAAVMISSSVAREC